MVHQLQTAFTICTELFIILGQLALVIIMQLLETKSNQNVGICLAVRINYQENLIKIIFLIFSQSNKEGDCYSLIFKLIIFLI